MNFFHVDGVVYVHLLIMIILRKQARRHPVKQPPILLILQLHEELGRDHPDVYLHAIFVVVFVFQHLVELIRLRRVGIGGVFPAGADQLDVALTEASRARVTHAPQRFLVDLKEKPISRPPGNLRIVAHDDGLRSCELLEPALELVERRAFEPRILHKRLFELVYDVGGVRFGDDLTCFFVDGVLESPLVTVELGIVSTPENDPAPLAPLGSVEGLYLTLRRPLLKWDVVGLLRAMFARVRPARR